MLLGRSFGRGQDDEGQPAQEVFTQRAYGPYGIISRDDEARGNSERQVAVVERRIVTQSYHNPVTPEKARLRGEVAHLERAVSNTRNEAENEMHFFAFRNFDF